jgi:hypothetical protein
MDLLMCTTFFGSQVPEAIYSYGKYFEASSSMTDFDP